MSDESERRQRLEILVDSGDIEVIREKIERDYGFMATDRYIEDLIVFVRDMLDGRDDRNLK